MELLSICGGIWSKCLGMQSLDRSKEYEARTGEQERGREEGEEVRGGEHQLPLASDEIAVAGQGLERNDDREIKGWVMYSMRRAGASKRLQ